MKLSPETLTILTNFATINKSILLRPGTQLTTRTEAIYASAIVAEEFPMQVGIVDLGNLLNAISLFRAPDLQFEENMLRIIETAQDAQIAEVVYGYAGEDMVTIQKRLKEIPISDERIEFVLSEDEIARLKKAVAIFQKPEICILAEKNSQEVRIGTFNHKLSGGDQGQSYTMVVEKQGRDITCKQVFDFTNLKLLKGDYACKITKQFTQFEHRNMSLFYLIASDPSSTFGAN